jgi:hypothetical protein
MKRIAAQDPLESQPAALESAVLFNGLHRVLGTGGNVIAATGTIR